jgi:metallo-beta-lactamase class B
VREVRDGETLRVGDIAITAHFTPGHTPGSTSWTWRSCEGPRCIDVVYADSLNPVSDDAFRFTPQAASFRRSIDTVAKLPCDLVVSVHPDFTGIFEKLAKKAPGTHPFIDANGCREYAADAMRLLDKRLAKEQAAATQRRPG